MESGVRQLTLTDLNTLTPTKQEQYGAIGLTSDGRQYRYVGFSGTSAVAPGLLCVASAVTAAFQALAITAVNTGGQTTANLTAGSTQIVLTNGATAVTQDQFAEGYIEVLQTSGTAQGPILYKVRGNSAAAATTGFITVYLSTEEPLRNSGVLVAGTDVANLNVSPYSAVGPSTTLNNAIGFTTIPVPNSATVSNFGWVQSNGYALVQNDAGGTLAVGTAFAQSTTTAGDVVAAGATSRDIGQVHAALTASNTGKALLYID